MLNNSTAAVETVNAIVVNTDGKTNILSIRHIEVTKPFIPWGNKGASSLYLEGSIGYELYKDRATAA